MPTTDTISVTSPADFDRIPVPYDGFNTNAEEEVKSLVREFTHTNGTEPYLTQHQSALDLVRTLSSMSGVPGDSPFSCEGIDERLDPTSERFNSKFWIKNMRKLLNSDLNYYKPTSLGIAYRNLCAKGISSDSDFQETVFNAPYKKLRDIYYSYVAVKDESRYFEILKPMDGLMKSGELTVVLSRPGGGASTLLRSLAAYDYGFKIDKASKISYDGLTAKDIKKHYRGEVVYSAETDSHFPHLTVAQTLEFAATLRTPENRPKGVTRAQYAQHMTKVYMATYGLSHTNNTKVGNDFVRGISGGEKKRVSIAETSLCGANIQCWDNATRGLDAATALEFVRALKTSAMILDTTPLIAIYQCSQDAYDLFDNVVVLYEGYQIYHGPASKAKFYFEQMGWDCPPRQTTADFLTSITAPSERVAKIGFVHKVPNSAKEFSEYWRASPEYAELIQSIDSYIANAEQNNTANMYADAYHAKQSKYARPSSPFTVSYWMQIKAVCRRNIWRLKADPSITVFSIILTVIMSFIISSLYYNLPSTTSEFYLRGSAMFFALLYNSFSSMLEVVALYEARDIVEKHKKYALYHPSADALASIITDLPGKAITSVGFNLVFYFMVNFRREPGRFFFYWMISVLATLVMSHIFRTIGSCFSTLAQSMTPSSIILVGIIIFTGFVLPTPSMHGWCKWLNYIDPLAYVFEALMVNEFSGRNFECSQFIPSYNNVPISNKVCNAVSAQAGSSIIDGTKYIALAYHYHDSHKWRNFGIIIVFIFFFLFTYLALVELNGGAEQKGEVIVFQQSTLRKMKKQKQHIGKINDLEASIDATEKQAGILETGENSAIDGPGKLLAGKDIFHWRDVCYEVQIKKETRRILDHVDGWVKPGTLTALMGASGAGKTTLLDVLANRVTMGVVTGQMFVNGNLRDQSFQRSTGYVQQQDIHLDTSTIREALRFSAYLRQAREVSKAEKDEYVENVIRMLGMEKYADAIVGIAGEGLNVEQRKRLTIAVELAAKPQLLLFLDEPTSGLDSQTAWSICQLMRKLANNGQAILCTIHQPSAILMQQFDRLLFLEKGGRTVYFGDLGSNCQTMIDYFEKQGAHVCSPQANPAEWMLEVIGAAPGSHPNRDYHEAWLKSDERQAVKAELMEMESELVKLPRIQSIDATREFTASVFTQYLVVTERALKQHWRTPSYTWSKLILAILSFLLNGFSFFKANTSLQGLQNQMLGIFLFIIVSVSLIDQLLPQFIKQRGVYEVRERPSKTFSWVVFILSSITSEVPWCFICGTLSYFCWYYPVGSYSNAALTDTTAERGALVWLFFCAFYMYAISLGYMAGAPNEWQQNASNVSTMLFSFSMNFCGALVYPSGFWSFMYRCSPFTYFVAGMLGTAVGDAKIVCSETEYANFPPPSAMTCGDYMKDYISEAGGYLKDESANNMCSYCPYSETNSYLKRFHVKYSDRWKNFGIFICFIFINCFFMLLFYWLFRVPKKSTRVQEESTLKSVKMTNDIGKPGKHRSVV